MTPYVCDACGLSICGDYVVMSPSANEVGERFLAAMLAVTGEPEPPKKPYHRASRFVGVGGGRIGGHMQSYLCGPLRERNDGDDYVEWAMRGGW